MSLHCEKNNDSFILSFECCLEFFVVFEVSKLCILQFLVEPLMIYGTLFGNRLRITKIKWEIWEGGRKHGVWVQLNQGTVQ
jgi:hypothetical protein